MRILFASTNRGKLHEMQALAASYRITIVDPRDLISSCGPVPEVAEDGATYAENALLKAKAFAEWSGLPTVADDTGIEVDALGGRPGVRSARYAGENASGEANRVKLLDETRDARKRTARFRCVLCYLAGAEEQPLFADGTLEGSIAQDERGTSGFGYDPLFLVENTGQTLSELKGVGEVLTHRGKAFDALMKLFALGS